jgi:DNA repair protein RecN (Recombination protein N)
MLALRLVLRAAPPVLVFDEVDAGIGGAAALQVGRALAALAADHQVLVVTHLPQVAAYADSQVTVAKEERGGTTVARAATLAEDDRVVELSRMLSGTPDSQRVRDAASELLTLAARERLR